MHRWTSLFFCLVVGFTGCASLQKSPALDHFNPHEGYRYETLQEGAGNSESLLVILTFSGGGTRAMAMAYGVLEELRRTPIVWEGTRKALLDEVDVISAVSGGSFTAAAYGLHREKFFDTFAEQVLYRDIDLALKERVLTPSGLYSMITSLSRTDIANRFYDRYVFNGATYADFPRTRPFILISATDMIEGARFEFSQEQMDLLCIDLSKLHVSRAVTASSSFPFLFKPLKLENHAGAFRDRSVEEILERIEGQAGAPGRLHQATILKSYVNPGQRPTISLVDGGLSDIFALQGPYDALSSKDLSWSLRGKIESGKIKTIAVIVVDAATHPEPKTPRGHIPRLGLFETVHAATAALLNSYAYLTLDQTYDLFQSWKTAASQYETFRRHCEQHEADAGEACLNDLYPEGPPPRLDLHLVHLQFDGLPDKEERHFLNSVETSLSLPRETVDRIREAARKLLRLSPQYQALLASLQGAHTGP